MKTDEMISMVYEMEDGSPAYDEQSADRVHIWNGEVCVVTLTRFEGGWIDVEPAEVKAETLQWHDVEAWIEHNSVDSEAKAR
ncbi:hypothetical protein [Actinophytocola sp.]|uniref:hypothetical protein n=1 Tax=Actinophytocola sp. TaxID=1872138 RepID=UPI00389A028A